MSGLRSLSIVQIITDPAGAASVAFDSLVRNVSAEGWFYGQIAIALALGLAVDIARKSNLAERYGAKSVRLDFFYGALELLHIASFTILLPFGVVLTRTLEIYAPWLRIDAVADLPVVAQLLIVFVVTDFWIYWWHRLQHESKIVWQFHKTHHSQVHLNAMTTFRATLLDRAVMMIAMAFPAAMMNVQAVMPAAIAAVLQFHQLFTHSNVGWNFGWLDRIFVTPSFHEVHHSSLEPHLDKNYGGVLSIWDHMFGTFAPRGDRELVYGLVNEVLPETWLRQQMVPVTGLWRLFQDRRNRAPIVRRIA
jgi:sterol desaturase/sphingolipid hydroxylase (fatty acid hydroxylase superfamily)